MLGEGGQEIRHFILASAPFWIEYRRGTPGILDRTPTNMISHQW